MSDQIDDDLKACGIDMPAANERLHAMVDVARFIEGASHEVARYVTEPFTDASGDVWASGPSAVSHAAKQQLQMLWRKLRRPASR